MVGGLRLARRSTASTPACSSPSSRGTRRPAPSSTTRRTRTRRGASSRRRATPASRSAGSPRASTSSCTRTRWWPSSSSRRWASRSTSRWWTGPRSTTAPQKPELWEVFSTGFVFSADPANHVALRCTFQGWWCNEEKERLLAELQARERRQEAQGHHRPHPEHLLRGRGQRQARRLLHPGRRAPGAARRLPHRAAACTSGIAGWPSREACRPTCSAGCWR